MALLILKLLPYAVLSSIIIPKAQKSLEHEAVGFWGSGVGVEDC